VLMNPWYEQAKARARYFVSELVAEMYSAAAQELAGAPRPQPAGQPLSA